MVGNGCPWSIGELVDRLVVESIKCHHFNHEILKEQAKPEPDDGRIARLLSGSQAANEQRVKMRDAVDRELARAIKSGEVGGGKTARTYGA